MSLKIKNLVSYYLGQASIYDKSRFPWVFGSLGIVEREEISKILKGKILECGVGTGRNAISYGEKYVFFGCDISREMIRCAKTKLKSRKIKAELILADAQTLPFKDEVFDSVTCSRTFKFFPKPLKFLRGAKRVLKKRGKCIIAIPPLDCFWFRLTIKLGLTKPSIDGSNYYFKKEIKDFLKEAGFDNTGIIPIGNTFFGFFASFWFLPHPTPFAHIIKFLLLHPNKNLLKIGRKWFSSYILVVGKKINFREGDCHLDRS